MVIVGAGECGARACLGLRDGGYQGAITLVGAEPYPAYERPPLSKQALVAEADPSPKVVATSLQLEERKINFIAANPAVAIDRAGKFVSLADGTRLAYDKLLLATGAEPRRLGLADALGQRAAYLRNFDDMLRLRHEFQPGRRIAIVGGGFIGLELAASARRRGASVCVIEALARLLSRGVPEEIATIVAQRHRAEGVEIVCGLSVATMREDGAGIQIALSDGRSIAADLAVIGVGALPSTALAEAAGLSLDNGIAVDDRLATNDPAILAAGDCCSFPLSLYGGRRVRLESWRNALDQGALAARNMMGAGEPISAVPWFWSDQFELILQIAGLIDEGKEMIRRDLGDGTFILFHLATDGRLVAASGIGKGNAVAKDIRLAEKLILQRARPDPASLVRPEFKLKSLLAGSR